MLWLLCGCESPPKTSTSELKGVWRSPQGSVFRFETDGLCYTYGGQGDTVIFRYTVQDSLLDFVPLDSGRAMLKLFGIYRISGDTLRMALQSNTRPAYIATQEYLLRDEKARH